MCNLTNSIETKLIAIDAVGAVRTAENGAPSYPLLLTKLGWQFCEHGSNPRRKSMAWVRLMLGLCRPPLFVKRLCKLFVVIVLLLSAISRAFICTKLLLSLKSLTDTNTTRKHKHDIDTIDAPEKHLLLGLGVDSSCSQAFLTCSPHS